MIVEQAITDACLGGAVVTATFDDVTGEISRVAWDVKAGVLSLAGIAPSPIIAIAGDSGYLGLGPSELAVDAPGIRMTRHPKGGWVPPWGGAVVGRAASGCGTVADDAGGGATRARACAAR